MTTDTTQNECEEPTVGARLKELGLSDDPFRSAAEAGKWWSFHVFGLRLTCYNFAWRRKALAYHDLHHVVTGYPCTMKGEMQVATWEFAAGPCPNRFAQLFCLPLVAMGAAIMPRKTFAAFREGRQCRSLFGLNLGSNIADWPVLDLRTKTSAARKVASLAVDIASYAVLVSASTLMYLLPAMAALLLARYFLH